MTETFYGSVAAGVGEIKQKLPGRCDIKVDAATFQHVITVRPNDAITVEFIYNEWYPSRVPKIRVKLNKSKKNGKSEKELEEELKVKAKGHEYLNTLMIPMLVEYVEVAANQPSTLTAVEEEQTTMTSSKTFHFSSEYVTNGNMWAQPSVTLSSTKHTKQSSLSSDTWGSSDISTQAWSIVEPVMEEMGTQMDVWGYKETKTEEVETNVNVRGNGESKKKERGTKMNVRKDGASKTEDWGSTNDEKWDGDNIFSALWSDDENQNKTKQDDWKEVSSRKMKSKQENNQYKKKAPSTKYPKDSGILGSGSPNYFLAVRCTDRDICESLEEVVTGIVSTNPLYKRICYNRNEIHVTLCTLALYSQDQIDQAVRALQSMKSQLVSHKPKESLKIEGVSEFSGGKVVYAKVHCPQQFLDFRSFLMKQLQEEGVYPVDTFEYVPHMTIGKINKSFLKQYRDKQNFPPDLYNKFTNKKFGSQRVEGVHLCKMGSERREDGFYTGPTEIML